MNIIQFFKRMLEGKKTKKLLLDESKNISKSKDKNDFFTYIKSTADLEQNDGNGYRIKKYKDIKDMI